jgi:RNA polymerase sigma-70 factor (ECF subfamily)
MSATIALPATLLRQPRTVTIQWVHSLDATDSDLLQRIGGGDPVAFEALYRRYARSVFGLALRRLGDRGTAEDAVQETFVAVWRSAASYRPERGPGAPWLYAVARNAIADRYRKRPDQVGETPEMPDSSASPGEQAEAEWLAWTVHQALEQLPEAERTVIELAYWSGLSQSEVADFLGIPLGTVKTRTRSGLGRLAAALEGELR